MRLTRIWATQPTSVSEPRRAARCSLGGWRRQFHGVGQELLGRLVARADDAVAPGSERGLHATYPDGSRLAIKNVTSGTGVWPLFDLHGDVAALENSAMSAVTDALRYDAYGVTIDADGSFGSPWKFQGALDVAPSSEPLYDIGARMYPPSLGAWTSLSSVMGSAQDPLSMNRFLYAEANPATLIDPTGHKACTGANDADCDSIAPLNQEQRERVKKKWAQRQQILRRVGEDWMPLATPAGGANRPGNSWKPITWSEFYSQGFDRSGYAKTNGQQALAWLLDDANNPLLHQGAFETANLYVQPAAGSARGEPRGYHDRGVSDSADLDEAQAYMADNANAADYEDVWGAVGTAIAVTVGITDVGPSRGGGSVDSRSLQPDDRDQPEPGSRVRPRCRPSGILRRREPGQRRFPACGRPRGEGTEAGNARNPSPRRTIRQRSRSDPAMGGAYVDSRTADRAHRLQHRESGGRDPADSLHHVRYDATYPLGRRTADHVPGEFDR